MADIKKTNKVAPDELLKYSKSPNDEPKSQSTASPKSDEPKSTVRTRKRDLYFGACGDRIWDRKARGGYVTIPKTALLISELIGKLEKDTLLPFTMLGLWFSTWDDGFVEVLSEERLALECGFVQKSPNRRTYEWRKRIEKLADLGLIEIRRSGDITVTHILVLDPHRALTKLYSTNKRLTDGLKNYDSWRYIFERLRDKAVEVGARDLEPLFDSVGPRTATAKN